MNIKYPVFVRFWTGSIDLMSCYNEVVGEIESLDVGQYSYSGWDASARPLEFFVKDDWPAVRLKNEIQEIETLEAAIVAFAGLVCPKIPFEHPSLDDVSLRELWNDVVRHLEGNTSKWRKFLMRFWS